jgi:glycosyltransferase involved in cell wall biosynthesis
MNHQPTRACRLAIVVSHPIQYYAPWFVHLTANLGACMHVFYLSDAGVTPRMDHGFGHEVCWDIDLLSGYAHSFVPNMATDPGTHHFFGLRNPGLIDALADWKPDAILLFGYRSFSHLRLITSSRLRRIPFLFRGDSHLLAEGRTFFRRLRKRWALRLLFRRFAVFLSVGRANAEYFRRHGVRDDKISFAPHGVDQERFHATRKQTESAANAWRRELDIPESHRVILFAGKFERKKGPDDLICAFINAAIPNATLVLVGAGPLESKLRKMAGDHPSIRFAPFQNQSAMPRTYAAADLVVLPSSGADESWGFAIHEALACGKAVMVSDRVGCHLNLVEDGRNGLVFPAGNTDALGRSLAEAMKDGVRLKLWGQEGGKIVSTYTYAEATRGLARALKVVNPGVLIS